MVYAIVQQRVAVFGYLFRILLKQQNRMLSSVVFIRVVNEIILGNIYDIIETIG